jgi:hypothetical protein
MNKEQEELVGDCYKNYLKKYEPSKTPGIVNYSDPLQYRPFTQEQFINKCKTDSEFSEKWGLKIEERELSGSERYTIARQYGLCPKYSNIGLENCTEEEHYNKYNIPTKLITITYNDKTIESYV